MKNISFFFAATISLFFACQVSPKAQITSTWKGGTPGRCCDWNCATNWKEGRVPNEFSNVVITDVATQTFCYPVVFAGEVEVKSIELQAGCVLEIFENARLYTNKFAAYYKSKCIGCEKGLFIDGQTQGNNNILADTHK